MAYKQPKFRYSGRMFFRTDGKKAVACSRLFKPLRHAALLLLPLFLVWLHCETWPGHVGVYNWGEPDFGYLLNSADLYFGAAPGHTDHPGTPVQSLGTAVLYFSALLHSGDPDFYWYDDLLKRPSAYHLYTSWALLACAAAGLWALGTALVRRGYSVGLALFLQLLPFLAYNTWYYVPRVSPEKMMFFLNAILAGWLITVDGEGRKKAIFPLMLGLLLGFSLATKYNTITLFAFLLLVPGWKGKATGAAASVASFILFTLPMAEVYGISFRWLGKLSGHTGIYGLGEKGIVPGVEMLADNFGIIWFDDKIFLVACLIAFVAGLGLAWRRRSLDCAIGSLVLAAHFALVMKHPASRYLIPMAVPLLLVAFHAVKNAPPLAPWLAIFAILPFIPDVFGKSLLSGGSMRQLEPIQARLDGFRAQHSECEWGYISPVPRIEWAMSAGNGSAARRHTQDLLRVYPHTLSYDVWPPRFHRFSVNLPFAVVEEKMMEGKGCLYLGGLSYNTAKADLEKAPFQFDIVAKEKTFYVLKVKKFFYEGR